MTVQVWGVTMVRDEQDVIEQTLRHLHAEGLDGVVVLENRSADDTPAILARLKRELFAPDGEAAWLVVVEDPEPGYWQSAKMTAAARTAGGLGATWVIPFDADEIWYDPAGRRLAEAVPILGNEASIVTAELYDHRCTALDPEMPADVDDPFTRMGWRHTDPLPLPKVAVRVKGLHAIHPGNHGATYLGTETSPAASGLHVRHFPYRSAEQFVRKARNGAEAYAATTLPRGTGQHWREYGETLAVHGPEALEQHYTHHFTFAHPAEAGLIFDPAPLRVEPSVSPS